MKFCGSIVCPRNFLSQNLNDANFAYSYAYNNVNFIRNSFYVTSLYVASIVSWPSTSQV